MWGEPREGTEAHKVQQEVEKRKKQAKERGLPQLLCDVWFDTGLKNFYSWQENSSDYIHPDIKNLKKSEIKDVKSDVLEFDMRGRHYSVISESESYYSSFPGDDGITYTHKVTIKLNDKKVFSCDIQESYGGVSGYEYSSYSPSSVTSYVSDEWENDFRDIKDYYEIISEEKRLEYAEDPEKTNRLKEDFGIEDAGLVEEDFVKENTGQTIVNPEAKILSINLSIKEFGSG